MTSQLILVEIIAEMKEPMQMPRAYAKISAPFQLVMFAVAGIGGYLCMGNKAREDSFTRLVELFLICSDGNIGPW